MGKSKALHRNTPTAQAANSAERDSNKDVSRPRTAGGEKGLLRKFRFGRIFGFGGPTTHEGDDGAVQVVAPAMHSTLPLKARGLFRTSSVQAPQSENGLFGSISGPPLPPPMPAMPDSQTAGTMPLPRNGTLPRAGIPPMTLDGSTAEFGEQRSRMSILSRRSSAPDTSDLGGSRLSRYSMVSGHDIVGLLPMGPPPPQFRSPRLGDGQKDDDDRRRRRSTIDGHVLNSPGLQRSGSETSEQSQFSEHSSDTECLASLLQRTSHSALAVDTAFAKTTSITRVDEDNEHSGDNNGPSVDENVLGPVPQILQQQQQQQQQSFLDIGCSDNDDTATVNMVAIGDHGSPTVNHSSENSNGRNGRKGSGDSETLSPKVRMRSCASMCSDEDNGERQLSRSPARDSLPSLPAATEAPPATVADPHNDAASTAEMAGRQSGLEGRASKDDAGSLFSNHSVIGSSGSPDSASDLEAISDVDDDDDDDDYMGEHKVLAVVHMENSGFDLDSAEATASRSQTKLPGARRKLRVFVPDENDEAQDIEQRMLGSGYSLILSPQRVRSPSISPPLRHSHSTSTFPEPLRHASIYALDTSMPPVPQRANRGHASTAHGPPMDYHASSSATSPLYPMTSDILMMGSVKARSGDKHHHQSPVSAVNTSTHNMFITSRSRSNSSGHSSFVSSNYSTSSRNTQIFHPINTTSPAYLSKPLPLPPTEDGFVPLPSTSMSHASQSSYFSAQRPESPPLPPLPPECGPVSAPGTPDMSIRHPASPISELEREGVLVLPTVPETVGGSRARKIVERLSFFDRKKKSRTQSMPTQKRPKSLYEQPVHKSYSTSTYKSHQSRKSFTGDGRSSTASDTLYLDDLHALPIPQSSNKLKSLLPQPRRNTESLLINTQAKARRSSAVSLTTSPLSIIPMSAPVDDTHDGKEGSINSALLGSAKSSKAPSIDSFAPTDVHGSQRMRSKLESIGMKRSSTYGWGRSSMFLRSPPSAEDLNANEAQKPSDGAADDKAAVATVAAPAATTTAGDGQAKENGPQPRPSKEQESDTTSPMIQPVMIAKPVARKTPAAMRMHSARELVITEKNFVDHLFVIKKVWMEPVFSSINSPKPIIPYQTARMVFDGIASLHSHASQFYREMDAALSSFEHHARAHASTTGKDFDDGMRMGRLFRSSERHWSDFITYVRNYGKAVRCLNQLQDYKPFARYHEECMLHKRTNRQSLKDLLMLPVQRVTRYTLLLKNILKHTPVTHGDHVELCRAVKNASRLASIVNECRRKQEEGERVMELFQAIALCPPMPYADSRAFVTEFIVRELISRQPTRLILFNDMLVVAQAPAQAKIDVVTASANETAEAHIEWTYYGSALLDQVEVQNADESTNTLITILSLNRSAAVKSSMDDSSLGRRSLPGNDDAGSDDVVLSPVHQGATISNSPEARPRTSAGRHAQDGMSILSESTLRDAFSSKKKPKKKGKIRKGILQSSGSGDAIPDHIAALSHSTFPSPVPSTMYPDLAASRASSHFAKDSSAEAAMAGSQQMTPPLQPQRPKTSQGLPQAHSLSSASTLHLSGHSGSADGLPPVPALLESANSSTNMLVQSPPSMAPPKGVQLTLVMQHTSSSERKKFVMALKDASTRYASSASTGVSAMDDPEALADLSLDAASGDVLSLHPM